MKRNKTHLWQHHQGHLYWQQGWAQNETRTCRRCQITAKKSKARVTVVPPEGEFALGEKVVTLAAWEISSPGENRAWLTWKLPACG